MAIVVTDEMLAAYNEAYERVLATGLLTVGGNVERRRAGIAAAIEVYEAARPVTVLTESGGTDLEGVWLACHRDGFNVVIFATEVEALRHALAEGKSVVVVFAKFGEVVAR